MFEADIPSLFANVPSVCSLLLKQYYDTYMPWLNCEVRGIELKVNYFQNEA